MNVDNIHESGIIKVFNNADSAEQDIEREADSSEFIKYLGSYNTTLLGRTVFNETLLYKLLSKRNADNYPDIEFIHISPDSKWASIRAAEISFPLEATKEGVTKNDSCLWHIIDHLGIPTEKVHLRHHDSPLRFRLLILPNVMYLNMYLPLHGTVGRANKAFKIRKDTELFAGMEAYYSSVRDHASYEINRKKVTAPTERDPYTTQRINPY